MGSLADMLRSKEAGIMSHAGFFPFRPHLLVLLHIAVECSGVQVCQPGGTAYD